MTFYDESFFFFQILHVKSLFVRVQSCSFLSHLVSEAAVSVLRNGGSLIDSLKAKNSTVKWRNLKIVPRRNKWIIGFDKKNCESMKWKVALVEAK